jgi:outer membrane lipoprotein carrier protein
VTRYVVWCALVALPTFAADPQLDSLLKNVEGRYNRSQSLKLDFSETYAGLGHAPSHTESGTLYLKKPGRMRWEYSSPAGKLFVSDGKDVFLYTPDQHRAEKSKLKQSEDMRAPLAFLLGKLDFAKEFKSFETRQEGADTWITAEPKNPNLEFSKVEFLAAPNGEIRKLRVTGIGNSRIDFTFSNEALNAPVTAEQFTFHPPPGVEVRDTGQ